MPRKKTATKEQEKKEKKYWEAVGRRKTAVARVRIYDEKEKAFLINNKTVQEYFSQFALQKIVFSPLELLNLVDQFSIRVKVKGGGIRGQAEAIRHGLSRVLVMINPNLRKKLKKAGFLTRDPRMKERKKPGLKRARRAPQWQKR